MTSEVDGRKPHVDASLIDANASKDSVVRSSRELRAALKEPHRAQERKLQDTATPNDGGDQSAWGCEV